MRRRGLTLLETMLAGALTGAVLLVCVQVLTPALRIWLLTQVQADTRTKGNLTYQRLFSDMRASTSSSVQTIAGACSFLGMGEGGYDPVSGRPLYREVIVYQLQNGSLYRKTWRPGQAPAFPHVLPSTQPFQLTPSELSSVCASAAGQPRRLCTDVATFEVARDGTGWLVTLDTEAWTQKGKVRFRRQSHVVCRNAS